MKLKKKKEKKKKTNKSVPGGKSAWLNSTVLVEMAIDYGEYLSVKSCRFYKVYLLDYLQIAIWTFMLI